MFSIIERPIEQTLSPIVSNAIFLFLGMDAVFLASCVGAEKIQATVADLNALWVPDLWLPCHINER